MTQDLLRWPMVNRPCQGASDAEIDAWSDDRFRQHYKAPGTPYTDIVAEHRASIESYSQTAAENEQKAADLESGRTVLTSVDKGRKSACIATYRANAEIYQGLVAKHAAAIESLAGEAPATAKAVAASIPPPSSPAALSPQPSAIQPAAPTSIATKVSRANDQVAATIATATAAGVRWRWLGDDLETTGLEHLSAPDRALLERLAPGIAERLRAPDLGDAEALLERLDLEVELIEDMERALEVVATLPPEVGLDTETMTRGDLDQPWLAITKAGTRAARQPTSGDAPLDPHRGQPRLISVYDPGKRITYLFDVVALGGRPEGLLTRRVIGHNLLFDLAMLGAQGQAPASSIDTLQIAAMLLPPGQRELEDVAEKFLGIPVPKALQKSNWATPQLSNAQLAYAGADPALAFVVGKHMHAQLDERERTAFAVANRAVPAIARMRLRGLPFDPEIHAAVVDGWQQEFATQREAFERITGAPAPASDPGVRTWLTERLSEAARRSWTRSETGLLSIEAAEIKKMALDWPEVRPLLDLRKVQTRVRTFGTSLIERIVPVTGRLHSDYHLPMITGRMSSSRPNLQNLPTDARVAVRAPEGKLLICGDLNQIELRCAAELSGDPNMRGAFAAGEDLHDRYAQMMRPNFDQLAKDSPERASSRKRAKAGHFGNLFAQTTPGLRKYAWKAFDLELTMAEAAEIQAAFYAMYPAIGPYQQEQFRQGQWGILHSVAGRPRRAAWEQGGMMWLQLCANYAIQASAADVLLEALRRVDLELPGTLIAAVHDELLLEVDEGQVDRAARVLEEQMTEAFLRWFPQAPILDLVKIKVVSVWADATD